MDHDCEYYAVDGICRYCNGYEPAWLTEATFELGELMAAIESGDNEAWDRFQAKQDSEDDAIWQGEEQHE